MLDVLTETHCDEVNIQITQRDDFILKAINFVFCADVVKPYSVII